MNFAFYVSGAASRFRAALKGERTDLLADTRLVFADSDRCSDLAGHLNPRGIRFVCADYNSMAAQRSDRSRVLSDLLLGELRACAIDYCFCFGSHILGGELLREYAERIVNFHPSILPAYPGLMAVDQALRHRSFLLGNTAHFVVDAVDAGPVIMQSVTSAEVFDSAGYDGVLNLQLPMLYQIYDWLKNGRLVVEHGKVRIAGVKAPAASFFPPLEQ